MNQKKKNGSAPTPAPPKCKPNGKVKKHVTFKAGSKTVKPKKEKSAKKCNKTRYDVRKMINLLDQEISELCKKRQLYQSLKKIQDARRKNNPSPKKGNATKNSKRLCKKR